MIEVAIVSMEQALAADGEAIPEGSAAFEREPLGEAEARFKVQRAADQEAEPTGAGPTETPDGSTPVVGGQLPVQVETERPAPGA